MRTRWLFDFDGCIVNSHAILIDRINGMFGTGYHTGMIEKLNTFWRDEVLTPHRRWAWSDSCFDREEFLKRAEPNDGVIEAMQLLLSLGNPVFVVVDRPQYHVPWVARFLARHDVVVPVLNTYDYELERSKVVDAYGITTVVDDDAVQIPAYLAQPTVDRVFFWEQPWNTHYTCQEPIERLSSWGPIITRMKEELDD